MARGFAGLQTASFVALAASLGGVGAVVAAYALDEIEVRSSAILAGDLDERVRAGRVALTAVEEAKSELEKLQENLRRERKTSLRVRAFEVAFSGNKPSSPIEGLAGTGVVDAKTDRVVSSTWSALAPNAAISAVLPSLSTQLQKGQGPIIVEDARGVLAVAPRDVDGRAMFARLELTPEENAAGTRSMPPLLRAQAALSNLADQPAPQGPPNRSFLLFFAGACASALIGFAWAATRLGGPMAKTLHVARAFIHGEHRVRADVERGGRDARNVAIAVNGLIETAERLKIQGRVALEEDVRATALAIEALGKGDIASSAPVVNETLEPLRNALDRARRDMLEWMTEVNRVSLDLASSAADVSPGAKKIGHAALDQLETMHGLAKSASEATEDVKATTVRLGAALTRLATFAEEERKASREFQTALKAAGRRAQDLRHSAAQVESLAATAEAIDDAMDVLAQTANPDNPPSTPRVLTAVGAGRAAMEGLTRELALLREEMGRVATSLEGIAAAVPETSQDLSSNTTADLHASAASLLRIVELTAGGLKSLERSTRTMVDGAEQIHRGAAAATELAPRLGAMLAHFSMGSSFEEELMKRIEHWREEAEDAATAPDGLTEEGRRMLKQVAEASEAVRQRLGRLVSVTEAAIDALRG
jgi:methyl-accepting chemotaxis protein